MKTCSACNASISDNALFCPYCGGKVEEAAQDAQAVTEGPESVAAPESVVATSETAATEVTVTPEPAVMPTPEPVTPEAVAAMPEPEAAVTPETAAAPEPEAAVTPETAATPESAAAPEPAVTPEPTVAPGVGGAYSQANQQNAYQSAGMYGNAYGGPQYQAPQGGYPPYQQVNNNARYDEKAVMSVGQWMLTMLIMMIPFVNIVMLFVWAFGSGNQNRRNWSRASLIYAVIGIVIMVAILIIGVIAFALFGHYYSGYYKYYY